MMHLIQGVFDLTTQGSTIVGVPGAVSATGSAVEFVATRWNYFVAGVAIWRVYDFLLLGLVVLHGFNGLRYVLTDYTMNHPLLRRASVYLTVIAAVVLLVLGGGALLGTIDQSAIDAANEATQELIAEAGLTPAESVEPAAEATTAP
jgi:succinate dehydrogenase hydrophobic anchor subunit